MVRQKNTEQSMATGVRLLLIAAVAGAASAAHAFDIEHNLFMPGDLHASWEAGPVQQPPKMFESVPKAEKQGDRRLARAGKVKGGVTAFEYDNPQNAAIAYDELLKGMGSDTAVVEDLGDQARSYSAVTKFPPAAGMPDFHRAGVLFMRGNTVVYIGLADMKGEELVPFAKKIDLRIQK
jgi:hypothetical protein